MASKVKRKLRKGSHEGEEGSKSIMATVGRRACHEREEEEDAREREEFYREEEASNEVKWK